MCTATTTRRSTRFVLTKAEGFSESNPDTFAEDRLPLFPPAVCILLVPFTTYGMTFPNFGSIAGGLPEVIL